MLYPELDDKLVVTIMGACAQELYDLGHKDNFFYLQHAMGLASSIGLGLALHLRQEKIVVLDGDGSVLMNLGTLATLARYRPRKDRKSTRLNSSHVEISYAVFCLKKKNERR